jgi:hypothetical protein
VKAKVPEVERAYLVEAVCEASPERIAECARSFASRIGEGESFAVATVRRSSHGFARST